MTEEGHAKAQSAAHEMGKVSKGRGPVFALTAAILLVGIAAGIVGVSSVVRQGDRISKIEKPSRDQLRRQVDRSLGDLTVAQRRKLLDLLLEAATPSQEARLLRHVERARSRRGGGRSPGTSPRSPRRPSRQPRRGGGPGRGSPGGQPVPPRRNPLFDPPPVDPDGPGPFPPVDLPPLGLMLAAR